ncbi:conserved membrane hypothetical protein [Frankia canadensis]|uniref:DUF4395 domain-containing protein n=1 Tax=Frankia canadensis TaxID=1836972 RepID=A0A2I2KWI6_9ACTN|nr:DUF4395 domain-containing protein [Frankia canadensis]SNQ50025.1 conserved membrane hypothetical protein [Frankia canadensis]SOU57315.1 conserved membrane hypothetical protein [Frankia canadensis]
MTDPRGMRFTAAVTTVVLAVVLVTGSGWLLLAQTVVFAIGAAAGVRYAPYAVVFRALIRPRLGPPASTEDPAPPRFAQFVGTIFGIVGVVGFLAGVAVLGYAAAAAAFVAAFLNAVFEFCLGCQMYLFFRSITVKGVRA